MKKYAIQGNPEKGREIISLLESLGGNNHNILNGYSEALYYFVDNGTIVGRRDFLVPEDYKKITLYEALTETKKSMETKVCKKCGRELPVTEFNKHTSSKDGLQYHCKKCISEYQRALKDRKKQTEQKPEPKEVEIPK